MFIQLLQYFLLEGLCPALQGSDSVLANDIAEVSHQCLLYFGASQMVFPAETSDTRNCLICCKQVYRCILQAICFLSVFCRSVLWGLENLSNCSAL